MLQSFCISYKTEQAFCVMTYTHKHIYQIYPLWMNGTCLQVSFQRVTIPFIRLLSCDLLSNSPLASLYNNLVTNARAFLDLRGCVEMIEAMAKDRSIKDPLFIEPPVRIICTEPSIGSSYNTCGIFVECIKWGRCALEKIVARYFMLSCRVWAHSQAPGLQLIPLNLFNHW